MAHRLIEIVACCAGLALFAPCSRAQDLPASATVPEVQPAPDQWIAPIPDDIDVPVWGWKEYQRAQWVVWPSDDYIAARQPPRDRRRQFPAVYPHGDRRWPPLELGASSVRRVKLTCVEWLKHFVKPEYVPEDPEASLVLLQEPDPRQSWVASRFELNGTGVQVIERFWAICYVIRPAPALIEGLQPEDIGPATFRAVFKRGEEMAARPVTKVEGLPEGLDAFAADDAAGGARLFWYTDGKAVATWLPRFDDYLPRPPKPTDIWF